MRGWDMAYYFANYGYSFADIEKYYISRISYDDPMDERIAKIYFAFLQLYLWLQRIAKHNPQDVISTHIAPAIEFIEITCQDL